MWIFIWIVISCFILGVFFWSVHILFRQKRAWKQFAKKMNLNYEQPKGLLVSPIVNGNLGPYGFALFSDAQQMNDSRGMRYCTVIEFALRQGAPALGAVGTQKMTVALEGYAGNQSVAISDPEWDTTWFVRTTKIPVMQKYMSQPRIDMLKKIFRMKTLGALLMFNEVDCVLRLETADPLDNVERLDKIVKGIVAKLPIFIPTAEERVELDALAAL